MKYLFIDTETGGLNPAEHDILQLAWILTDENFKPVHSRSYFMLRTLPITPEALKVNKLTDRFLQENGTDPYEVYREFLEDLRQADTYVGHFAVFDKQFIPIDCRRRIGAEELEAVEEINTILGRVKTIDTKLDYIHLNPRWKERRHPGPYLNELCDFLGVSTPLQFHRADDDAEAMRLCMEQLKYQYSDTIQG